MTCFPFIKSLRGPRYEAQRERGGYEVRFLTVPPSGARRIVSTLEVTVCHLIDRFLHLKRDWRLRVCLEAFETNRRAEMPSVPGSGGVKVTYLLPCFPVAVVT